MMNDEVSVFVDDWVRFVDAHGASQSGIVYESNPPIYSVWLFPFGRSVGDLYARDVIVKEEQILESFRLTPVPKAWGVA